MKYIYRSTIVFLLLVSMIRVNGQFNADGLKLMEVFDKVSRYYVDSLDESELAERTIVQMLHELDPHSSYISKEDLEEISEQLNGEFEGIGVSFNILKDTIFIVGTIQGGPSERVGILAGDRIIKVNGENVAGIEIKTSGVQKRLKGEKGTKVDVAILRRSNGQEIDFTITRDKIPFYSLDASYMVDNETGYIKLSRFSQTTAKEFEKAIKDLQLEGMENLILDLSNNGGGYLRIAVELADHFLSDTRQIVYTKGEKVPQRNYKASSRGLFEEGKLVVMIDENSASASEIVSGAVQDWDRGVLVGRRSFGKGLVQQPFRLNDGSEMRLTIARYYTPTGRLIQKSYEDGYEDYAMDIINRYNTGELDSSDSVFFPKAQKFQTLVKGRTVYGGGGIMPDYFVPIDTTFFSHYYRDLISKGVLNQFALRYIDVNRQELEKNYEDFETFDKKYNPSKEMDKLIEYAEQEGLSFDKEQWEASKLRIELLFKAYIARDLWDAGKFYQIYNESDPIYQKAKEILKDPSFYVDKI
ncbi:MAG: S41 family peptidase [Bacteroidales bacterium]|jgi:carboxyl-terminal processing protease|nr:S41 family peptidase [Bacteroidales bacterium]